MRYNAGKCDYAEICEKYATRNPPFLFALFGIAKWEYCDPLKARVEFKKNAFVFLKSSEGVGAGGAFIEIGV